MFMMANRDILLKNKKQTTLLWYKNLDSI